MTSPANNESNIDKPKDYWNSNTYSQKVAPFVPALTHKVVQLLDPQPDDIILDLGCGDGVLTAQLSHRSRFILGIDSSPNMIDSAQKMYTTPNATYLVLDGLSVLNPSTRRELLSYISNITITNKDEMPTQFTKIFSNAALHWILRPLTPKNQSDHSPLISFYKSIYALLTPGGYLVTESGALGNVSDVHTALLSALIHIGIPAEEARAASPWFFPSTNLMRTILEQAGFEVQVVEAQLRQTELVQVSVEGWVRLFAAVPLDKVEDWIVQKTGGDREEGRRKREDVIREVCEVLEGICRRVEDGKFVLNYIRLRVKARKPE